jgi:hypothetical protein
MSRSAARCAIGVLHQGLHAAARPPGFSAGCGPLYRQWRGLPSNSWPKPLIFADAAAALPAQPTNLPTVSATKADGMRCGDTAAAPASVTARLRCHSSAKTRHVSLPSRARRVSSSSRRSVPASYASSHATAKSSSFSRQAYDPCSQARALDAAASCKLSEECRPFWGCPDRPHAPGTLAPAECNADITTVGHGA